MQKPAQKQLARIKKRIATALKTTKHAQSCVNELSFMNGDTLEAIERDLSEALSGVQALASH